ncbi:MAG: transporter [Bacteroidota bacterium]|nr:transporter [Bacteroidota bacterium]
MKQFFSILLIATSFILLSDSAHSQGCVAIRSTGGVCTMEHSQDNTSSSKWILNVNNRYFKSFRHFVGTKEQKQRIANGSEVINHSYTLDLTLTRILNKWWSISLDAPILANSRSSLYEHDGKNRFLTHSFGLGDIRLSAYRWVFDPSKSSKGNIQFGLGVKLPTGDYKYQDLFHKNDSTIVLGPVDQSIQLGDGGLGFSTELNAYYNISKKFSLYSNLYYLLSPREQNGTLTSRGGTPSASSIKNGSFVMSVPDQYMIRAGANFTAKALTASVGFRDECLPVHDLIGGSKGFRRPGYILSAEPGITYDFKKFNVYAYVPIALVRNRTQSVADKIQTQLTGLYTQGDAAFADYTVNVGFSVRF